ncbi:MAG: hypothetical protein KatS3mg029_0045 [Saprospiraceae bacterium]|nr:MAG: hypothetical protein KatS3mg029_0045 [Saprospiraceae bacterium]
MDFSSDTIKKEIQQHTQANEPDDFEPPPSKNLFSGINTVFKVFFGILAVSALIWMIFWLNKHLTQPPDDKLEPVVSEAEFRELRENLPEAELQTPLEMAKMAGQYDVAVRLLFLSYLQGLIHKGLLHWRPETTNGEYLQQLNGSPHEHTFKTLMTIFETVWYGRKIPMQQEYPRIESTFESAIEQLSS